MLRFLKNKKTQRIAALALAATIATSVFVFGPKKKVQAAPINGDSVNALYDEGKYNQGGKVVEVLRAVNASGPYVYCVKASSALPVANGGTVNQDIIRNSTAAQDVMGKIKAIVEMSNATIEGCSDWETWYDANGQEGYIVRQLLIWNEIYKARASLGNLYCSDTDDSAYFRGYDLNSLTSSGYPLVRVAKEIAASFDAPESYIPKDATYEAIIGNISNSGKPVLDTSKGVYYVTFDVTVKEKYSGSLGGNFKFTGISGCSIYPTGSSTAVNTSTNYASGSTFRAEGSYNQLVAITGGKGLQVQVMAVNSTGNPTQNRIELGFFKDTTSSTNQTFVALYVNTTQKFEGGQFLGALQEGQYTLTKYLVHPDR